MKVDFLLVSDLASVSVDQKLSVMGIFDTIHATSFPCVHAQMSLAFSLSATQKEKGKNYNMTVRFVNKRTGAADQTFFSNEVVAPQTPLGEPSTIRQVCNLNGLPFQEPGLYEFQVMINGDIVGTTPLYVRMAEAPALAH